MNSKILGKGIFVAVTLLAANNVQAVLIDNFNSGDDAVVSGSNPGPSNTASGDAIGGSRTLEVLSGAPTATSLAVANGALNHGQSPVSGGSSATTWDSNGAGLGGVDLTDSGSSDGIQLDILAIDVGLVDLTFEILDTLGAASTLALANLSAGVQSFFFSDFSGTANFSTVDSIVLTIDAQANSDLSLDLIDTIQVVPSVPEPATLALLGLGLAGIGAARKKKLA